ncbi:MAG TPA: hypothetical protein VK206_27070, partial [Anaerolineales bacterium]|nr:hypothetical protein [Anaerolineales bacterium]
MPIVEQSRMRLEYPAGDEVPGPINDKIVLRARVSPARINTRVWFAFQIDEEPWVRREAVRESASADSQQYSLTVDISTGQTGLKYLAYVRRNGVTVPSGADSTTPYNNQRLQEFTAFLSLTNEDSKSRDPHSGNEIIEESGVKFPDKDASAGTPIAASLEAAATESGASLVLREQPAELREASAISSPRTLLSEIQPSRDVPTTSTEPLRSPQPSSPITSAETNPRHVEGHVFVDRGLPGNGIRLRIYNREGDGTETRLGEVTTDERGSYTLAYDIGRNTANLEVRGLDAQGNEVPLSELNVDAARSEVMNLIARADLQRYASGETLCAPEPTAADNAKWTIPGRLQSQSSDLKILAGCRVDVFFEQKTLVEAGEEPVAAPGGGTIPVFREAGFVGVANENPHATETAGVKMRVSVRPDDLGIFMVMLPSKAKLAGRIVRFMVSSPSGETLADKCFDIDTIPDFVLMPITRVASIPQPTVVPLPETRRIKGKVIERNCRPLPSCLQILLFAHKNTQDVTEAGGEPTPIFVASTDSSGYFFGEIPNQKYESAMAKIAGIEDQIYIALEDGYIPARVLLVVDLPENGLDQATRDGCNCAVSIVPRTPTYSDIEEASDTYSADLGAGGCIQFNTPNRAIEEFDFYSVVRTTEPDIRALGGDTSHGTTHVGNSGSDILTDDLINAVELATKALNQEVEATTSDTAAEVAEAEKIATQREAEAKAAREYLTEIEGKNLGDFISHTGNETIFLTEKYLQDQRALVERAEAVATAARVAADSAKVRAATAEVAEAERIATQREAEAKAAREYLTEIEGKNLGDFISHPGNETIFLTEKYLQDQRALVERAEAVATAARV